MSRREKEIRLLEICEKYDIKVRDFLADLIYMGLFHVLDDIQCKGYIGIDLYELKDLLEYHKSEEAQEVKEMINDDDN